MFSQIQKKEYNEAPYRKASQNNSLQLIRNEFHLSKKILRLRHFTILLLIT